MTQAHDNIETAMHWHAIRAAGIARVDTKLATLRVARQVHRMPCPGWQTRRPCMATDAGNALARVYATRDAAAMLTTNGKV